MASKTRQTKTPLLSLQDTIKMASSIDTVPADIAQTLLAEQRALREEVAALRATLAAGGAPSGGKPAKSEKPREPRGPSTNPWIHFTQRVERLVREAEAAAGTPKEAALKTVQVKQFASDLKTQKPYEEWTDGDIQAALPGWTPPEHSKQELAGLNKRGSKSGSGAGSEAGSEGEAAAAPAAEKPKRVLSPEHLAKMKAGREAAAAKKAAAGGGAAGGASAAAAAVHALAPSEAPPAAAPKKVALKPKPAAKPAVDLRFYAWAHKGTDYFTNDRGDVVSTEFEWVGRYNKSADEIDETAEEPADLAEAEMRD